MRRAFLRIIVILVSLFVIISIFMVGLGFYAAHDSFPQVTGEIQVAGLNSPVEVYRDGYGVPHIYATSDHDLFFTQGYIHAQDCFWQMDFWRHTGSGRLSELFGASSIDTDMFLRTLGWERTAQEEIGALDPGSLWILEAYAEGVNAYLADHKWSTLSLEYSVLKLLNVAYQPEPWKPIHTLTWAKAIAWDLSGNMDSEIEVAILLKELTPEELGEIEPPYPIDHPYFVPDFHLGSQAFNKTFTANKANYSTNSIAAAFESIRSRTQALEVFLGPKGADIGSNIWVISGKLTTTGKPLLANDPHLSIQMPSIWYEVGLHCLPKGPKCNFEVTGVSFAGAPGVIISHNNRIAWGFTNVGPDVQDLYIEKINPLNPYQYEVNGEWKGMKLIQEVIQVAGDEPVEIKVLYTRHGPIISDAYGSLEDFGKKSGVELPQNYAIAIRWIALEISLTFPAIWKLDLAQNFEEFRSALFLFDVPSQNIVYADIDGNIGYQTPSKIPIRTNGDGSIPVPGWVDDYEWTEYIPFDELPYSFNPDNGYIVTANNAVVGPDYPYLIS